MMDETPRLLVRLGNQPEVEFQLAQPITIVGRETLNDLVLNDAEVSRRHCRLVLQNDGYMIEDLGSTNGTFVNGKRVTAPLLLYHGDTIELGKSVRLVFLGSAAQQLTQPMAPAERQPAAPAKVVGPAPARPAVPPPVDYDYAEEYIAPDADPVLVPYDDEAYYQQERPSGFQRFIVGAGCLILVLLVILGVMLFVLDRMNPQLLYCGPLEPFWQTVLGPFLEQSGRVLNCP